MTASSVLNIVLVAFAFGFVIFWHELGHFLAARWACVRVEQFAVGMGQAIASWRKGIGFRPGNTQAEFDRRVDAEIAKRKSELHAEEQDREWSLRERYDVARDLGLGETDYRLNWIPLGGYVKPTGQDDLRPAAQVNADDPHAFGAKPVGKRMVIIVAGVIMNVILAFALYVFLFLYGFNAPPAKVGLVLAGSPAEAAGLRPGDRIVSIDGKMMQDFTKLRMNIALLRSGEPANFTIERDGKMLPEPVKVTPVKSGVEAGMSSIGVGQALSLAAPVGPDVEDKMISPDLDALPTGSRVVRVGDVDVSAEKDTHRLIDAVNDNGGRPVQVRIEYTDKVVKPYTVTASLAAPFNPPAGEDTRSIAGLQPRVKVAAVQRDAPAHKAGLLPGDVVEQISTIEIGEAKRPPSVAEFIERTSAAGKNGHTVRLTVARDGESKTIDIKPTLRVERRYRMGVNPDFDLGTPTVSRVLDGSPFAGSGLAAGDTIVSVNGTLTVTWPDVLSALRAANGPITLAVKSEAGERTLEVKSSAAAVQEAIARVRFQPSLPTAPLFELRQTRSPIEAAQWGYFDTKEQLLNVYVTLRRLFEREVPVSNLSGPIGIFSAGTSVAKNGIDWVIWFTALISANLAVVNFLPIPIVDGGLFAFLVAEKITGRPPSPRVQTAAQLIGILLLGSLFLFVTYHDILRQFG